MYQITETMNKSFVLLVLWLSITSSGFAQKFGYVDSDFILNQMPSYQKAKQEISDAAQKWETDIRDKNAKVLKVKEDFRSEELLLTDEMRDEKAKEIEKMENDVRDLHQKYFGKDGLLFTRQLELTKPAQEELYKAIQKVARKNNLQFVFSNTEGLTILYAEPRHDYTEEVLKELGLLDEENDEENPEGK